MVFAKSVK